MVRRTNKNDLLLLGMILMLTIISMTSFTACSTTKVVKKEHLENVVSKDSSYVKSTDSHNEVSASTVSVRDSSATAVHEVITIYEVVYDTVGMPILLPSGEPMTYAKEKKDCLLVNVDSKNEIVSIVNDSNDSSTLETTIVEEKDSAVVITEEVSKKTKPKTGNLLVLLLAVALILFLAKKLLDKISG